MLCGLVAIPAQAKSPTCKSLFLKIEEEGNLQLFKNEVIHPIRDDVTGKTIKITRTSDQVEALNRDARDLYVLIAKNIPALLKKTNVIFQEYTPKMPYLKIAATIGEVQMALIDARGANHSQQALAKEGAENLRQNINSEIRAIKSKILETENLAYQLDMVTGLVETLSVNKQFQNNANIHNNQFHTSLSKILVLQGELKKMEAFKTDLDSVIAFQVLKPTETTKNFYENTSAVEAKKEETPIASAVKKQTAQPAIDKSLSPREQLLARARAHLENPSDKGANGVRPPAEKRTREFIPQEDHSSGRDMSAPLARQSRVTIVKGEQLSRDTTPFKAQKQAIGNTLVPDSERKRSRVSTEAPTYKPVVGTTSGSGTVRSRESSNPINPGRGSMSGSYVPKSGVTGKVDLDSSARSMTLDIQYTASTKIFPAKDILESLREWARKYKIQNDIQFSHTGRIEDPILVNVKIRDQGLQQFYLKKLEEDFGSKNAKLKDNLNPATRIQPAPIKPVEKEKPTLKEKISDIINYSPRLQSEIND